MPMNGWGLTIFRRAHESACHSGSEQRSKWPSYGVVSIFNILKSDVGEAPVAGYQRARVAVRSFDGMVMELGLGSRPDCKSESKRCAFPS